MDQPDDVKPGTVSATVGVSGWFRSRPVEVTASSLTSPAAMVPATGAMVCIIIGTRPAMTSFDACAAPG